VYKDLKPYICVHGNCAEGLITFTTRNSWAEHDVKMHRQKKGYECHDCQYVCEAEAEFKTHISAHHAALNSSQRGALVAAATRMQDQEAAEWPCPLCTKIGFSTPAKFKSHVCAHMEDIALGTLPREMYGSDEDDSSGEEGDESVVAGGLMTQGYLDQDKGTSTRCTVYDIRDNDWYDLGTGFCSCQILYVRDDNDCVTNTSA